MSGDKSDSGQLPSLHNHKGPGVAVERRDFMRQVVIEPAWKKVGYFQDLLLHPPNGYRFVYPNFNGPLDTILSSLSRTGMGYELQRTLGKRVPLQLVLSRTRGAVPSKRLVYAVTHLRTFGPYVLDMITELPNLLALPEHHFKENKEDIRNRLLSKQCRAVICWVEEGRQAFLQEFGNELKSKVRTVYWGKPAGRLPQREGRSRVKLLFVNSANIGAPWHFFTKGGKLVVEAFKALRKDYHNLELVLRSPMSSSQEAYFSKIPGVRVIRSPIPWNELVQEWYSSDIFVLPNHINTPANAFLDAMSFGLPIVTTDIWANPEIVQN